MAHAEGWRGKELGARFRSLNRVSPASPRWAARFRSIDRSFWMEGSLGQVNLTFHTPDRALSFWKHLLTRLPQTPTGTWVFRAGQDEAG